YSLQGLGLYVPMIVALRFPSWGPVRVLNYRPVAYVGVLSYSLYLAHHVVLNIVGAQVTASPLPRACAALAISMLIAWAIHQLVDKPCAVLRKKLSVATRGPARA